MVFIKLYSLEVKYFYDGGHFQVGHY